MRNNHVMRGLLIIMLALSFISGLAQEKSDFPDGLDYWATFILLDAF